MAIRYTVTTSSCPHCGKVLKRESDFSVLWLLLMVCTCFMALFWVIARAIINSIFKYEYVKMGSPYIECPGCGRKVNTGEAIEWGSLNKDYKRNWAFRNMMRICYTLGGTALFCIIIPLFGAWTSSHESDRTIALVLLFVAIFALAIIGYIYYKRKKSFEEKHIIVSETDYDLIKESWQRLKEINPELQETETIKISGTERLIYPPKKQNAEIAKTYTQENSKTKQVKNEESIKEDFNKAVETKEIEEPKEETNEDMDVKNTPIPKNKTTKHIIIAKKNNKLNDSE